MSVDNFKQYNDTYGHQMGDHTLQALAASLSKMINEQLEFHRYGGEEFIGVYRGSSYAELEKICNDFSNMMCQLKIPHCASKKGYVTVSVGYYFSTEPIKDEVAITYADIALYQAKEQGKDIAVFYESSMKEVS